MIDMNFAMTGEIEGVIKNMFFFQRKSFIKDEKPMRFICCCFNTVDRKQGVSKLNVSKIQKTYPAQGRGVAKYLCKKGVWGIHYIRNFIFSKRTAPNSKVI